MKLTEEQEKIMRSTGNIRINAVAGSGKTTTVIEYARSRPAGSRILYIAFNRSVKLEARKKFDEKKLAHVKVETAHSLAFGSIVFKNNYKVRNAGYKTHEIVQLLKIQGDGEKHAEYVVANHISKFISYFCNSDKKQVQELNYLDIVTDEKAAAFVKRLYPYIEQKARLLLGKMDKGEIDITHDFYLKKFQLEEPVLRYDYILFDEGQDASAAMLDIFMKQEGTKVIVGDTHQQIYGWRHAVNSLEKVNYETFHLSTSFRFSNDIAGLANKILDWKGLFSEHLPVPINGAGAHKKHTAKAVIARTNLGLLLKAIEFATEKDTVKNIYFEGNINSYTYADEGASLYDVLNLYNKKRHLIKDQLIRSMQTIAELEEYIDKTEDVQLRMMLEIVKKYENKIPALIKAIKEKHIKSDDKEKAEIIFSTVHRCKGMEYDAIQLAGDFITQEAIEKSIAVSKSKPLNKTKINEEINLLYVAVTRTKNSIHIPEKLLPKGFPASPQIYVIKEQKPETADTDKTSQKTTPPPSIEDARQTYSVSKVRETHKAAYLPWSEQLDNSLTQKYCEGLTVKELAEQFTRTKGAIRSRIKKLELNKFKV